MGIFSAWRKKTEEDVGLSKVCVLFVVITRKRTRAQNEAEGGREGSEIERSPSLPNRQYLHSECSLWKHLRAHYRKLYLHC